MRLTSLSCVACVGIYWRGLLLLEDYQHRTIFPVWLLARLASCYPRLFGKRFRRYERISQRIRSHHHSQILRARSLIGKPFSGVIVLSLFWLVRFPSGWRLISEYLSRLVIARLVPLFVYSLCFPIPFVLLCLFGIEITLLSSSQ